MSYNIVFQQKSKANVIIPGTAKMAVSELIQKYYKKVCASKKEKMLMKFSFNGNELSPDEGTLLKEVGMKDYSSVQITLDEPMTTQPYQVPKQPEPEPKHEEPPQYEQPQEEPQYEQHAEEEQPAEEQTQEEAQYEQPAEEQPAEEQPQEEAQYEQPPEEEQPAEEQPAEEQQQEDDWD